jgi:hypothetical protein
MRTKIIQSFGVTVTTPRPSPSAPMPLGPGPAPAVPKLDPDIVVVSFESTNEPCLAGVKLSPYDVTTHNRVLALHTVYFPAGQPVPSDAAGILAAVGTSSGTVVGASLDVSAILDGNAGNPIEISVAGLIQPAYTGVLLADFDA